MEYFERLSCIMEVNSSFGDLTFMHGKNLPFASRHACMYTGITHRVGLKEKAVRNVCCSVTFANFIELGC